MKNKNNNTTTIAKSLLFTFLLSLNSNANNPIEIEAAENDISLTKTSTHQDIEMFNFLKSSIVTNKDINIQDTLRNLDKKAKNEKTFMVFAEWYGKFIDTDDLIDLENVESIHTLLKFLNFETKEDFVEATKTIKEFHPSLSIEENENQGLLLKKNDYFFNFDDNLDVAQKVVLSSKMEELNPSNENALLFAVRNDWTDTSIYLLRSLAKINAKNIYSGRNILHYAIINKNQKLLKEILTHNLDVHSKDLFGFTPIELAMASSSKKIFKLIVKTGEQFLISNKPAILFFVENELSDYLKIYLQENGNALDKLNEKEQSKVLQYVFEKDIDVDLNKKHFQKYKKRIIESFLEKPSLKKLTMINEQNIDVNSITSHGVPVLFTLIKEKSKILPIIFLNDKFKFNEKDPKTKKTPLFWSVLFENEEAFISLLNKLSNEDVYQDIDSIGIILKKPLYAKTLLKIKYPKSELHISGLSFEEFISIKQPMLFKYLLKNNYIPIGKIEGILHSAIVKNNIEIIQDIFEMGHEINENVLKQYYLKTSNPEIKWEIEKKLQLYFNINDDGEIPFFEYLKKQENEKISYILQKSNNIPLHISDDNGVRINNLFHFVKNNDLYFFLFLNLEYKSRLELLNTKINEKILLNLPTSKLFRNDYEELFLYSIKFNLEALLKKIVQLGVLDNKFLFENSVEIFNKDILTQLVKTSTSSEILNYALSTKNNDSLKFIVKESDILNKIEIEDKLFFVDKLFENGRLFENFEFLMKKEHIMDLRDYILSSIIEENVNTVERVSQFLDIFRNYSEPMYSNFLKTAILMKNPMLVDILLKNGFSLNSKSQEKSAFGLLLLNINNNQTLNYIINENVLESKEDIVDFISFLIENKKTKLFYRLLQNKSYADNINNTILSNIVKSNNIDFLQLVNDNRPDLISNNIVFEAIEYSNKDLLTYVLNNIDIKDTNAELPNSETKTNPLEHYLILRKNIENENEILITLFEKFKFEENIPHKFDLIFKNNISNNTYSTILEKIPNKKEFLIKNEIPKIALLNNIPQQLYNQLLRYIDTLDEKYIFSIGEYTNTTFPIAVSRYKNKMNQEILKVLNIEKMDSDVLIGLAENNNNEVIQYLISNGIKVSKNTLEKSKKILTPAALIILNADEINPWWKDTFRKIKKEKLFILIIPMLMFILFVLTKFILRRKEIKKLENFSLHLDKHSINPNWGIEELKQKFNEVKEEVGSEFPEKNDFDSYGYYKYFLDLKKTIEYKEKTQWVDEDSMEKLLEEAHKDGNLAINDDELSSILKQIGDNKIDDGTVLIDDDSELELEVIEEGDFDRKNIDNKYLNIIKKKGYLIDELSDEELYELVHTLILNEKK